jgi:stress response protein YsnF
VSSAPAVVIDQNGERGVIAAFDPREPTVQVEHEGQTFLVPADLLTALGQSYFSLPTSFKTLARHETVDDQEALIVPVVAESLALSKRTLDRGAVRVHMTVGEREVVVDEPTAEDRVTVERVAINQPIDKPVRPRVEGDTTIIPVMKEVLLVRKQLMLVEEVRLTKTRVEVRQPQTVMLRAEEAQVERVEWPDGHAPSENQTQ